MEENNRRSEDSVKAEEKPIREMAVMEKLKIFVVQEPVVAASCLIAGFGLFLPAVVRPILDSFESSKEVHQPALKDVRIPLSNLNCFSLLESLFVSIDLVTHFYFGI